MGATCTKLCPWFCGRNDKTKITYLETELEGAGEYTYITEYKMLHTSEDHIDIVDNVKIKFSNFVLERNCTPSEIYEFVQELGSGAYGTVCKVRHRVSKELRAMKIIKKANVIEGVKVSQIEKEIDILKRLDHPNILKIYEFFQDEVNFYIITECCEHGDLFEKLNKMKTMNEIAVKILMYQLISSVAYLHSKNIIHGDLKLENILIENLNFKHRQSFSSSMNQDLLEFQKERGFSPGRLRARTLNTKQRSDSVFFKNLSNYEIKLIDFGCSKIFHKGKRSLSGIIGTSLYCSPEVLRDEYNEKCDLWSCGVIMYILLSGNPPFYGETDEEIENDILLGKVKFNHRNFQEVSDTAKDLILKLLTYKPDERISAKDALKHKFFKEEINPRLSFIENLDPNILSQLRTIKNTHKFQQAVLTYIAHNFANKDEVQKLRQLFRFLDKNDDGTISKEELLEGYRDFGEEITEENLNDIIKAIDNDGNGCIEYEEFIRASLDKEKLLTETNLKMAFDLFDIDKNGTISCEEIKQLIFGDKVISEQLQNDFMAQINKKVTDEITFEEFKILMLEN